ncbi:MAG: type I restriction enzyme HsdR N-terminal domain-containing protein [Saprospiraceae bacterium]|nr:type I restriction enzyme HsdR N-terminal domain-containing protein [Saprospiraceae bacterium]
MSLAHKAIPLDLLKFKESLNLTKKAGKLYVLDPIRKKLIVMQPEEMVRQLMICYFIQETDFTRNSIQVEKTLRINDLSRRFDIVIYDKQVMPYLLIECKAYGVAISQSVFDQIAVYNMRLNAPFLLVSNGLATYCARMNHETKAYEFLDVIPKGY